VSTTAYASSLALEAAFPAASNGGKSAIVGNQAPYTLYVSNGTAWVADRAEPGHSTPPSKIYVYEEDGSVLARCMPRKSRITQVGTKLWTPTALSGTAARTVLAYTGAAFLADELTTGPMVEIVSLDGTYCSANWTGLSIPAQPTGIMQLLVWLDDFQNGAASPFASGSVTVRLTTAAGGLTWTFASPAWKPGWNTLQLWDPSDANVHAAMNRTGISTTGTKTIDFSQTITGIEIVMTSPAINTKMRVAGLFSQTKAKPMVCVTFDVSAQDVFSNFVPAWYAKNLSAGLRSGGSDAFRASAYIASYQAAYDQGFDIYNGSWSRLNLNTSTTSAQFAAEVGKQKNWQSRIGLHRGAGLFSSAGNGLPKASIYRDILPKFGLKSAKSGGGLGRINVFGPAGLDDRYAITAIGWPGRTGALQQIDAAIKLGGFVMWFGHQCEIAGAEPPPDSASPGSGGGMYQEDAVYFANYLKGLVDAGTLDVVSPSQLDDILDGIR